MTLWGYINSWKYHLNLWGDRMAEVKFVDHTEEVKHVLESLALRTLEEASGELESQVKRRTPVGKVAGGQLKNSWQHHVQGKDGVYTANVGSPLERSLWIEFGTGEYALPDSGKSGRKGGWYIPVGEGEEQMSESVAKAYGMTIRGGKDGKKWVFTLGMKPQRPFYKAYSASKNKLIRRIQNAFKGKLV